MQRFIIGIAVSGILASGFIAAIGADPSSPEVSKAQQKMIEAAKKTYEASSALYEVGAGGVTLDALFIWSRRWADAEADGADPAAARKAYLAHLLRMKQLADKVDVKHEAAALGGEEDKFQASRFYLAEAEYLLAKYPNPKAAEKK